MTSPRDIAARQRMTDRLVTDFELTTVEAADLVSLLGTDWNSLIREARIIRAARDKR